MQYELLSKYVFRSQDITSETSPGEQRGGGSQQKDASLHERHLSFRHCSEVHLVVTRN